MENNINTDLTLADAALMLEILEVCASRGSFKPGEFLPVGKIVTKLEALTSSEAQAPLPIDAGDPPPAEVEAEVEAEDPRQLHLPLEA